MFESWYETAGINTEALKARGISTGPIEYFYQISKMQADAIGQHWVIGLITLLLIIAAAGLILWRCKCLYKNTSVRTLLIVALGIFTLNVAIGTNWLPNDPSEYRTTSHNIGIVKAFFEFALSIIPIITSFYICNKYWKKMEEDFENKIFSGSIYPTLMVAQGTFFTFVGVASVLISFGISKDGNTDQLLNGLKLAFFTSVIGLIYSIAAKIYVKERESEYKKAHSIPVLGENDFYNLMSDIKDVIEDTKKFQEHTYNEIHWLRMTQIENAQKLNAALQTSLNESNQIFKSQMVETVERLTRNVKTSIEEANRSISQMNKTLSDNLIYTLSVTRTKIFSINEDLDTTKTLSGEWVEENKKIRAELGYMSKKIQDLSSRWEEENGKAISIAYNLDKKYQEYSSSQIEMLENIKNNASEIVNAGEKMVDTFKQCSATTAQISEKNNDLLEIFDGFSSKVSVATSDISSSLSTSSGNITKSIDAFNDSIQKLDETVRNYKTFTDDQKACIQNASRELSRNSQEVRSYSDDIVEAYEALNKEIIERNEACNQIILKHQKEHQDRYIETQEKIARNIEAQTVEAINIVADVLKKARDEYKNEIKTLHKEIDSIKRGSED